MKKLTIALIFLFTLVIAGFAIVTPEDSEGREQTGQARDGKVLGIHHYNLLEGVDSVTFEAFVRDEWEPSVNGTFPGVQMMIMKGERNANSGQYILVYELQSLDVRDYYWPTPGEQTEAALAAAALCGDVCDRVWDQFEQMVERTEWADFVALEN